MPEAPFPVFYTHHIGVIDKNEAFFVETKRFSKFYSSQTPRYDWDHAPSTPCPNLVEDIAVALTDEIGLTKSAIPRPHVYDLAKPAEDEQFVAKCGEYLLAQMSFFDLLDKKTITEDNFLDVFEYWDSLFGKYVKNGRKSSEYFLADIEKGNFPGGFLIWNLDKKKHLKDQALKLDVFNADVQKIGTKIVPSVERTAMLNKWYPRPKWDGHSVMPMFSSALNQQ